MEIEQTSRFLNLKLVTSSDPCFTAGLVDHGCDLHRSIQRNLGGRWLHVTWRKWSYSQWFFLHDFKGVHMTVVNKFNLNPRPRDLDGSTWLLSKPFRTRPTDYIQGFSYIYISNLISMNIHQTGELLFCTWCRGPPSRKSLPTTGIMRTGIRWSNSSKPRLRVADLSPISH